MYTRIISGAVAVVIAIVLLALYSTFVFNIAIAFISMAAIYELFKATKLGEHKLQMYFCLGFAFLEGFMDIFLQNNQQMFFNNRFYFGLFILAMCLSYLRDYQTLNYKDFFSMIGITMLITYSFNTLIYMSNNGKNGLFVIVLTLAGAWLADTGAYFAGTFLGKTPLCPKISPKKTVEGVFGGIVANGFLLLIISLIFHAAADLPDLRYIMITVAGMACALIGLVGDLTASIIKRQCRIKDYGNLMPGHGGVMDRFDSLLLVAPFMYYLYIQGLIFK